MSDATGITIRAIEQRDADEIRAECATHWGSTEIWSLGYRYLADSLPGFVAEVGGRFGGFITLDIKPGGWLCEVITLSSRSLAPGTGAALLAAAEGYARERGCRRIYLTTTNDNTKGLRFYQRQGWRLAALHKGIVDKVREVKRDYPLLGIDGIQIRDEIEIERWLD
jgi:GNAT superfamily N-acetyltransferase